MACTSIRALAGSAVHNQYFLANVLLVFVIYKPFAIGFLSFFDVREAFILWIRWDI